MRLCFARCERGHKLACNPEYKCVSEALVMTIDAREHPTAYAPFSFGGYEK